MMRKAVHLLLLPVVGIIAIHTHKANAETYHVVPDISTSDDNDNEVYSLPDALQMAHAGDTIKLGNGEYTDQLHSRHAGEKYYPITIRGGEKAVMKGNSTSVLVQHSWITLEGFTVDGRRDGEFVNRCVEVNRTEESGSDTIQGVVIKDMNIKYCGGECVRLKNFVSHSTITGNTIKHCGVFDFGGENDFHAGDDSDDGDREVNGEGIYIGTSITQWINDEEDNCDNNVISNNVIKTHGNECVEVKEGSSKNIIEHNMCRHQCDRKAGCYALKGDDNILRFNYARNCLGAGVRVGSTNTNDDGRIFGVDNDVYDNDFVKTQRASISVRAGPQGLVCGNTCDNGNCDLDISGTDELDADFKDTWNERC